MKRSLVPVAAAVILAGMCGEAATSALPDVAYGFSQQGGSVQFVGFPLDPQFTDAGGLGILRFGVSARDLTFQCYEEGTNTWVLREIYDRLVRLAQWNGERLLEGEDPVPVAVVGLFDLREATVAPSDIRIPRLDARGGIESVLWDRYDPNQDDGPARYVDSLSYRQPVYEPVVQYPPVLVVQPVVNNYIMDSGYDRGGYAYYPYHYGSYSYPYSPRRHYRLRRPRPRPDEPGPACEPDAGSSGVTLSNLALPRAERWGQARQISRKFTDTSRAWSWKAYLNPSQLNMGFGLRDDGPSRGSGRPRRR